MVITEIYNQYQIHKGLREHMIRVAAVAKFITDTYPQRFDANNCIAACLLHDMGNLIKSNIDTFPDMYEPEGQTFWRQRKTAMLVAYGDNEEVATEQIVSELGVPAEVMRIVAVAKLSAAELLKDAADESARLLLYADMRVQPYHIVSIPERFTELRERYVDSPMPQKVSLAIEHSILEIETELFADGAISPADITDESTAVLQQALWHWDIPTS